MILGSDQMRTRVQRVSHNSTRGCKKYGLQCHRRVGFEAHAPGLGVGLLWGGYFRHPPSCITTVILPTLSLILSIRLPQVIGHSDSVQQLLSARW